MYVQNFIAYDTVPEWIEARLGCCDDNVRSYVLDQPTFRGLALKYEDIVHDPLPSWIVSFSFLGAQCAPQRIAEAVGVSSFVNMKMIVSHDVREGKLGFFSRDSTRASIESGHRFMSRGRLGGNALTLTPAEQVYLLDRFGPTMERSGYSVQE